MTTSYFYNEYRLPVNLTDGCVDSCHPPGGPGMPASLDNLPSMIKLHDIIPMERLRTEKTHVGRGGVRS
jgi:hypothetical protein